MNNLWENLLVEIGFFTLLGVLYYFYQKRKIIREDKNKGPLIAGYILQCSLVDRGENPDPELDAIIEALDDYLHNKVSTPPFALLRHFAQTKACSPELKEVILEGLSEWEQV